MVTKLRAYQFALDALNNVWTVVSDVSDLWAREPSLRGAAATNPVQRAINEAIKGITTNIGALESTEKKARSTLGDIATRLEEFMKELASGRILNAVELVTSWKVTVERMLGDIAAQIPELVRTPLYRNLSKKLAA